MNKYFAVLILSLLFNPSASSQTNPLSVRDDDEFRGPVRSVRTEIVSVSKQNGVYIEGPRLLVQTKNYSSDGRQCETIFYKRDESQAGKDVRIHNEAGKWTEWDRYDANGWLVSKRNNNFDEGGRITEELTVDANGVLQQRKVLIWSSMKDKIDEIDTYNGEGVLIRKDVSHYDYRSRKLIWDTEELGGKIGKQIFDLTNRDPRTRLEESVNYNANGSVAGTNTYTDTPTAQNVEQVAYDAKGSVAAEWKQDREYDSQKNVIKITRMRLIKETGISEPVSIIYNTISYY